MKWLLASFILVGGCRVSGPRQLVPRATFDLGCPVSESQVTEISRTSYGVEACGCRATYLTDPDVNTQVWVLNSVAGESCQVQTNKSATN